MIITGIDSDYLKSSSSYSFLRMWKKVLKDYNEDIGSENIVGSFLDSNYALIKQSLADVLNMNAINLYKVLDVLRTFVFIDVISWKSTKVRKQVATVQSRVKMLVLERFDSPTILALIEKYKTIPGGFLGIAQLKIVQPSRCGNSGVDKLLRKLAVLLLLSCCTEGKHHSVSE